MNRAQQTVYSYPRFTILTRNLFFYETSYICLRCRTNNWTRIDWNEVALSSLMNAKRVHNHSIIENPLLNNGEHFGNAVAPVKQNGWADEPQLEESLATYAMWLDNLETSCRTQLACPYSLHIFFFSLLFNSRRNVQYRRRNIKKLAKFSKKLKSCLPLLWAISEMSPWH